MPTKHRRYAITETPPVKAALDELRGELGDDRVDLGDLVVLGAEEKLMRLRAGKTRDELLEELADEVRRGDLPAMDVAAADEVKRTGLTPS